MTNRSLEHACYRLAEAVCLLTNQEEAQSASVEYGFDLNRDLELVVRYVAIRRYKILTERGGVYVTREPQPLGRQHEDGDRYSVSFDDEGAHVPKEKMLRYVNRLLSEYLHNHGKAISGVLDEARRWDGMHDGIKRAEDRERAEAEGGRHG